MGQTLKHICRMLVEKCEGKWQFASRECTFEDSIVACFWEKDDSRVQQRNFVNASFCVSWVFAEEWRRVCTTWIPLVCVLHHNSVILGRLLILFRRLILSTYRALKDQLSWFLSKHISFFRLISPIRQTKLSAVTFSVKLSLELWTCTVVSGSVTGRLGR